MGLAEQVNRAFAASKAGQYFKVSERNSNFTTEIRAGVSLFLTIAYILVVNADILTATGGPCSPADCTPDQCSDSQIHNLSECVGSFQNPLTNELEERRLIVSLGEACKLPSSGNPGYLKCKETVRRDITTATAVAALVFSALMGLCANMPLALAPGMGINAYFAFSVVGVNGSGMLTYGQALAAVFTSGAISFLLAVVGLRSRIAGWIPGPVRCSTVAGIGLLLVLIGVQDSNGLGLVSFDPDTILALGACPPEYRAHVAPVNGTYPELQVIGPASSAYMCLGGQLQSATAWLGIAGFLIISLSLKCNLKGAMIYGILFVTAMSWVRGTPFTYFPDGPIGDARYAFFKKVVSFHPIEKTLGVLDFSAMGTSVFWAASFTILYATIIDSTSVIDSMAKLADLVDPNDETQSRFPKRRWTYCIESLGEGLASLVGCSPAIVFVESAVGIKEGGRTGTPPLRAARCRGSSSCTESAAEVSLAGVTALTTAALFGVSLFFTPIFASVPPFAVGPPLIAVGILMMGAASGINWNDIGDAFPAFATMVMMPYTYSILNGILAGLAMYTVLHGPHFVVERVQRKWGHREEEVVVNGSHSEDMAALTSLVLGDALATTPKEAFIRREERNSAQDDDYHSLS